MTRPLTKQQKTVYDFIRDKIVSRGYGPTVREIGEHMHIKSPNGVMCHLRALERKGMIVRKANKSRAIELTEPIDRESAALALGGSVSQGLCRFSEEIKSDSVLDLSAISEDSNHFGMRVQDDSLAELSIRRGDILVVSRQSGVESGQLAIIELIDAHGQPRCDLRFVISDGSAFRLQPTNRAIPATTVDYVQVHGVVVGVVRQYAPW